MEVEGAILTDTVWGPDVGEIHVVGPVMVQGGAVLTILPGTQVRLAEEATLVAEEGSGLDIAGEPGDKVSLAPMIPGTLWATVGATGTNSWIRMVHAEVLGGQYSAFDGAAAELEESLLTDFRRVPSSTILRNPILVAEHAAWLRVQRCTFRNYHEVLLRYTLSEVIDSLFEEVHGDGLDFDYAPPGCVLRSCTFRGGAGTNIDAVDVGSESEGVTIEACIMHGFSEDKGVSIGERSRNIVVRDCVIWDVDTGVAVKDSSEASIFNCTIADSAYGFRFYEKISGRGGGHAETWNNILWGNGSAVTLDELSSISVAWSNVEGGYTGEQNLDLNPGFRHPASADYRLLPTSPLRAQGREGEDLGARFPAGSSLVDTDGDALPDPWELQHDLDFNDPEDAETDSDEDGLDNLSEFQAGTDPHDRSSTLALTAIEVSDEALELAFEVVAGRSYAIEFIDVLSGEDWTALANLPPVETDDRFTLIDGFESSGPVRWYRVRLTGFHYQ